MRAREFITESRLLDKPTPTVQEIAAMHGVEVSRINQQLQQGIQVELEHTRKHGVAQEIALDHLSEDPNYYSKLTSINLEEIAGMEHAGQVGGVFSLNELFDPGTALPLEWERMPGTRMHAGHKPKDALYATAQDKDGRNITVSFVPMPDGIVGIAFERAGSMGITGRGSAAQIFTTVVDAINKYIAAEKPTWISFSASEPSRAKLYQHMVKRLSDKYELLSPEQYPASEDLENAQLGVGTFFLLRRK